MSQSHALSIYQQQSHYLYKPTIAFVHARIRRDHLIRKGPHDSTAETGYLGSAESPKRLTNRYRDTGERGASKEQGARILQDAAQERPEPVTAKVVQVLEHFGFDKNTEQDGSTFEHDTTRQVILDEKEVKIAGAESEPSVVGANNTNRRRSTFTQSLTGRDPRSSLNPRLSRPPVGAKSVVMRPTSLLVASLGNPPPYHSTRHSAAHIILKHLQSNLNLPTFTPKSRLYGGGHVSVGTDVGRPEFTLWQSPSLMNVSGPPLLKAWKHFLTLQSTSPNEPITGLIVLHDEMETEPGRMKVKRGNTSPRGHNGIKSVQNSLQSAGLMEALGDRYVKIGIGIGRPSGGTRETRDVSAYVLGQLTSKEKDGLEGATSDLESILYQEMARIGQRPR